MKGARHRGSTLTRVSLSQIDNWPHVAPPVYLSCLMAVMLYGLFCARSIDVPAVLASFCECNGFLRTSLFIGLARIPRVHPPDALYGCTLYLG